MLKKKDCIHCCEESIWFSLLPSDCNSVSFADSKTHFSASVLKALVKWNENTMGMMGKKWLVGSLQWMLNGGKRRKCQTWPDSNMSQTFQSPKADCFFSVRWTFAFQWGRENRILTFRLFIYISIKLHDKTDNLFSVLLWKLSFQLIWFACLWVLESVSKVRLCYKKQETLQT